MAKSSPGATVSKDVLQEIRVVLQSTSPMVRSQPFQLKDTFSLEEAIAELLPQIETCGSQQWLRRNTRRVIAPSVASLFPALSFGVPLTLYLLFLAIP